MRIQHNITAINAANQLSANDSALSSNIEKLSSGYKINSAADDAAGLTISEKMRAQIAGLDQAEQNAENATSLTETADGALDEVSTMLTRMQSLATEAANGTNDDDTDRANLQDELNALETEIDNISSSTNFNGISLLDGSLSGGTTTSSVATFDAPTDVVGSVQAAVSEVDDVTISGTVTAGTSVTYTVNYTDVNGDSQSITVTIDNSTSTDMTAGAVATSIASALKSAGLDDTFNITTDNGTVSFTAKTAGTGEGTIDSVSYKTSAGASSDIDVTTATAGVDAYQTIDTSKLSATNTAKNSFSVNGVEFAFVSSSAAAAELDSGVNYIVTTQSSGTIGDEDASAMATLIEQKTSLSTTASGTSINVYGTVTTTSSDGITFQVGTDDADSSRISLTISNTDSASLGISGISIKDQGSAEDALTAISAAIDTVSSIRSNIGAVENQLNYTEENLTTTDENLTSAESTIRDVDMSTEVVEMTKNEILEQAATSMLSQANSLPQSVLTLLQ